MPIDTSTAGVRRLSVPVELPCTVGRAWELIATGPGISRWFAPTEFDGRVGGEMVITFSPELVSRATVTAWDPPRGFDAANPNWLPGAPGLDTRWRVAEQGAGVLVTVEHELHTDEDTWDPILAQVETGWGDFFAKLQVAAQ